MAADQAAAAPQPDVAETVIPDVAATMITSEASGEARESTTLMPAWQPPPAAPAPADVAETVAIDNKAQPAFGTAPGAGRQAELTIESGPDAGHSHRAGDNALRLGRSPDNDVILRDPATSGHHARLERRGDQFWLVDLGSTNGTLVNGEPIQEKELNHGDRVTIGQNAVQFAVIGS
jgi:pSer/pThr/pTyr-binding forkhead associated (FHA) protein